MSRQFSISLLALLIAACGSADATGSSSTAVGTAPPPAIAEAATVGADVVTILRGGEPTATRIVGLIAKARSRVEVEMYELGRQDLIASLIDAHARGVSVTVIGDPSVDVTVSSAARLRGAGVDVLDYPVRTRMIDHVKLLVVDGTVAVIGGINWGAGSFRNHDFDAEVRGPIVANLDRAYQRDLVACGRQVPVPAAVEDPAILVATTLPAAEIKPLALELIDGATSSIDLDLYVLTDSSIVHAVERAQARGVAVRVLLDPSEHPSDASEAALLAAGVRVRRYRSHGEKLHAKVIVTDGRHVLFGSANWSAGGFRRNHELDIEIVDSAAVAAEFLRSIQADWDSTG